MNKIFLATLAALSLVAPIQAEAQSPAPGLFGVSGLTANAGAVSDYRFRGISQTFGKPATQFGVDYAHSSGLYVGNWNSTINEGAGFAGSHYETDFYGGYKTKLGDVELDVGAIYYGYPGSNSGASGRASLTNQRTGNSYSGKVTNEEVYIGATWNDLSIKYYYSLDNYFSTPDTKGSSYLDLSTAKDLGDGWGFNAHLGSLVVRGANTSALNYNYKDFKLGLTKDIDGWVVGASVIHTTAQAGMCNSTNLAAGTAGAYCFTDNLGLNNTTYNAKNAGASTVVLSVTKGF